MNKKQKILKAKSINKTINCWLKAIKQCIDMSTSMDNNKWILKCIPNYINYIDVQLAEAEKLGVDSLLDLQVIHDNVSNYLKIYDEIKEENN